MSDDFDHTQKIPRTRVSDKSIPSVCSFCGKLYEIRTWVVEDQKRTGVSHGMCPECFKRESKKIGDS